MVSKYSKSHTIVLGGDFNASLHREPPNNIDKMLRDCCSEAGLTTPDNYPVKPTFGFLYTVVVGKLLDFFFICDMLIVPVIST
jgi:hypothetical protein